MSLSSKIVSLSKNTDIVCPVCLFIVRHKQDYENLLKNNCCLECYENFRFTDAEGWDKGERPSLEQAREKLSKNTHKVSEFL